MSDRIDSAMFLYTLYSEITADDIKHPTPITFVTDNHSLVELLKFTESITEKRLHLETSGSKELIQP